MKKRQHTPQDVVIPIPDEEKESSNSNEKAETPSGSPASQGQGNAANSLRVDSTPEGYPRLACFSASDQNFMIYRSFSYLHARCLLYIQDEIACLEQDLDELDEEEDAAVEEEVRLRLKCRGAEDWEGGVRGELVRRIKGKLDEYGESQAPSYSPTRSHAPPPLRHTDDFLLKAKTLVSLQKPSSRDYKSVRTWFLNEEPLVRREQKYIECKEDLVTLRNGRECAGFDGFVEGVVRRLDCRLIRWLFLTPELRAKSASPTIHYFSPGRIDKLVALLITLIILVLLASPVIALVVLQQHHPVQQQQQQLQTQPQQGAAISALTVFRSIGVLMVFTLTFSAAMSMLTRARRHEVFASSAA
ncbi:hypothetical protein FGG08_005642 [Glutinoglossum americanum]|uniref:DUF6594 domain-containing protein n=1 Tax=Glutinoglossum americanum TaxID=1670608 RepID=A0A9P8I2L0_9PEZI|nr:hypothetical protein FGG08_005642 [Glutinoglossum americanum]